MTSSSDRLISGLVEDLEPVRPLPRLRQVFALVLALWTMLLGGVLWAHAGDAGLLHLFEHPTLEIRVYLASFFGLLVASLGGTASALAAGVPGRERLGIAGMALALGGLVAAAVACFVGFHVLDGSAAAVPAGANAMCFREGAFFALFPAGVILGFLVRGWTTHPVRAALVALLASGALGALIVHVNCDLYDARHLLLGHLGVPIVFALLGMYPLAVVLRRVRN